MGRIMDVLVAASGHKYSRGSGKVGSDNPHPHL